MSGTGTSDPHIALKTEVVRESRGTGVEFILLRLRYSKTDVKYSLHANPNSFSTAGFQTTDFLSYLGFRRGSCALFGLGQCYSRIVDDDFDFSAFSIAFQNAFTAMMDAEKHLDNCGIFLDQPEGWGYFTGRPSDGTRHRYQSSENDGHRAPKSEHLKESQDEYFLYVLTFLYSPSESNKGWVFHYRPAHLPMSVEMASALDYLGMKQFADCPEFEFESCYWWFVKFEQDADHIIARNAHFANESFQNHTEHFPFGLQKLLEANELVSHFGMGFLPGKPKVATLSRPSMVGVRTQKSVGKEFKYDVAISFAGTERESAHALADVLVANGLEVFYDDFYPETLWGKDLVVFFDDVYRKQSRYAVMFISAEYVTRMWTIHERRSILARMLEERGEEYVLPIRVDDAEVLGLAPSIGYLPIDYGVEKIGDLLTKKLREHI